MYLETHIQINSSELSWVVHMTGLYELSILTISINCLRVIAFMKLTYLFKRNKKYFYHKKMKISTCSLLAISTIQNLNRLKKNSDRKLCKGSNFFIIGFLFKLYQCPKLVQKGHYGLLSIVLKLVLKSCGRKKKQQMVVKDKNIISSIKMTFSCKNRTYGY